jgi:hypothetical protein
VVDRGPRVEGLRGSGHLVAPGLVLTVAHARAGRDVVPAPFGRIGDCTAVLAVQALGFPRARNLLTLAICAETPKIHHWVGTVARLFPSAIRKAGNVFLSTYQGMGRRAPREWEPGARRSR